MLMTLLSTPGFNSTLTTVYIDGFHQEPTDIAKMLNIKYVINDPVSYANMKVSHHYKTSLTTTFSTYPVSVITNYY